MFLFRRTLHPVRQETHTTLNRSVVLIGEKGGGPVRLIFSNVGRDLNQPHPELRMPPAMSSASKEKNC